MSAESSDPQGRFTYWRLRFRVWRGTRPFWAGLITLLSGLPIGYFPYAEAHLGTLSLTIATTTGAGSLIIGVLLVTLGLTMWYHGIVRIFAGVASILLGLVSIPVSNLGGYGSFLLALVGGALSIAWAPGGPAEPVEPYGSNTPHNAPALYDAGDPVPPAPRGGEDTNATDAAADAQGGRNSAG